ncbi:hypothetical protein [Hymenobacter bucti]|uniref:Lipocalin-like domain-containing protein n=1 Tax=Hymenobacter bucti TaxID=1844114 RepID=A0ABW4QXG9_9BACT
MPTFLRLPISLLVMASCLGFVPPPATDQQLILGTWVCETDKNWKLVFTKAICTQYYSGQASEVDRYTLSNTSPQCGEQVPVEESTSYLQLTQLSNKEVTCYELNGVTAKTLSLRPIHKGGALVFIKQK